MPSLTGVSVPSEEGSARSCRLAPAGLHKWLLLAPHLETLTTLGLS